MIKLKNYNVVIKNFVVTTTLLIAISCGLPKNYISKIEGKKIPLTENLSQNSQIDNFIKPYRDKINNDMSEILAYNPETIDKSGEWQSNIGNLMADITMIYGNKVYQKRNQKNIDLVILNHGGIRSILPKGNLTMRNAYQIAPFENSLFVIELKGEQILEFCNYFINEKKPHPLSGISFNIDNNKKPINIMIQNKPIDLEKIYSVGTSDYLSNGGDNMVFFKKNVGIFDMDYKLRNILIDYLKDVDNVVVNKTIRVSNL
jgi:2',3'-cyclic-nucleotide 2'-phosphodiesterase (5'-nucleotidase family)